MSRLHCRGSIAAAVIVIALLSSTPANAQIGVDPGPPRERPGFVSDVITGAEYDILNESAGRASPAEASGEAHAAMPRAAILDAWPTTSISSTTSSIASRSTNG